MAQIPWPRNLWGGLPNAEPGSVKPMSAWGQSPELAASFRSGKCWALCSVPWAPRYGMAWLLATFGIVRHVYAVLGVLGVSPVLV